MKLDATSTAGNPFEDPISGLVRLFVTDYQVARIQQGECPARRAVFRRFHGCVHGVFEVALDLPEELRVGVFAESRYPAWIRFSADQKPMYPDYAQENGIAIKLFDVRGEKLLEPGAMTHDFLLQNIPRFFVDDAQSMYEFTLDPAGWLKGHPETQKILDEMSAPVGSVLGIRYWSCVPSRYGSKSYVKYALIPNVEDRPVSATVARDYLASTLKSTLVARDVTFTFGVQFHVDDESTPLDRATVIWDENVSPVRPLAKLTIPKQDVEEFGQAQYAENLSFSPWHALKEHEPIGSIQHARREVYWASAQARRWSNGLSQEEPRAPRQIETPFPTTDPLG